MSNKKITELVDLSTSDNTDVLPIVDVSATETKKTTKANLLKEVVASVVVVAAAAEAVADDLAAHEADTANPHGVTKAQVGLGNVTDEAQIPLTQKAAAGGVASLDGSGKVPTSQLPALALTDVFVVASQAAQIALTAEEGDVAVRTDLNKSFIHNGGTAGTIADWSELLTPTDAVLSVNGLTGAITLTTSNIAEGSNLYFTNERAQSAMAGLYEVPLTISTGLTRTTNTIVNNLSVGVTGGQSVIGGTGVTDVLTLKGTTGNGTLTSTAVRVAVGNNGATEAMTILNNGNVGIGLTDPSVLFHVSGTAGGGFGYVVMAIENLSSGGRAELALNTDDGDYAGFVAMAGSATTNKARQFDIGTRLPGSLAMWTNDLERATIISNGNFGIGEVNPATKLEVFSSAEVLRLGNDTNADAYIGFQHSGTALRGMIGYLAGTGFMAIQGGASKGVQLIVNNNTFGTGVAVTVLTDGKVGIGTTSPSVLLDVNSNGMRIRTARTPATAAASGSAGEICWDTSYVYVCTATNTWKRVAIATW